jgi:hypothetical protein
VALGCRYGSDLNMTSVVWPAPNGKNVQCGSGWLTSGCIALLRLQQFQKKLRGESGSIAPELTLPMLNPACQPVAAGSGLAAQGPIRS